MNYIELIRTFWRVHEEHSFSTTEIALYFHLLEVCNVCRWKNPFRRRNDKIMVTLNISYSSLKRARNRLVTCGVIVVESQAGNANVTYSLKNLNEVVNEVTTKVSDEVANEVLSHININKTKPNQTKQYTKKPKRFLVPTHVEVEAYCKQRNSAIDARKFVDFYTSKNWMIGKNSMTDWQAALRLWESRHRYAEKKLNIVAHNNAKQYEQF